LVLLNDTQIFGNGLMHREEFFAVYQQPNGKLGASIKTKETIEAMFTNESSWKKIAQTLNSVEQKL